MYSVHWNLSEATFSVFAAVKDKHRSWISNFSSGTFKVVRFFRQHNMRRVAGGRYAQYESYSMMEVARSFFLPPIMLLPEFPLFYDSSQSHLRATPPHWTLAKWRHPHKYGKQILPFPWQRVRVFLYLALLDFLCLSSRYFDWAAAVVKVKIKSNYSLEQLERRHLETDHVNWNQFNSGWKELLEFRICLSILL